MMNSFCGARTPNWTLPESETRTFSTRIRASKYIERCEPWLTLYGLRLVYEKNV